MKKINTHYYRLPLFGIILFGLLSFSTLSSGSIRTYRYEVDLTKIVKDRFKVKLFCNDFAGDQVTFHFPKVIPGTYKIADYGKYIKKFTAVDNQGNKLSYKKTDKNTFVISDAGSLAKITYWVNDTWDAKFVRNRVYPMAGTNIDEGKNFVLNAGGVFGYFEGEEKNPVEVKIKAPDHLYGMSVLPQKENASGQVLFTANDYHQLIDCPIMFAPPDTLGFKVRNAKVMIGAAHETRPGDIAQQFYRQLAPAMEATGVFLDSLPVANYSYILYFNDDKDLGKIVSNPRFALIKFLGYVIKHGMPIAGALEHSNSSFYYMIDPGPVYFNMIVEMMGEFSIHEFMHIITPLNLHSQYIGDFNYADPLMSKHLWLYEGITEYFAYLIQIRGDVITPKEFLLKTMGNKIKQGEKFPNNKMSFTEMSANVFERKYKKQYIQVYHRGAVLGMLLDIEIIRLTNGEKTLIDVVLELSKKYGQDRSFDEETFIDEFISYVHPDLKSFFDKYIEGREDLPYSDVFDVVGIEYHESLEERRPKHPIRDNHIKTNRLALGQQRTIRKVGRKDSIGFRKGDIIDRNLFHDLYMDDFGNYIAEGDTVEIPINRDGQDIVLPAIVEYIEEETEYKLRIRQDMTPEQKRFYDIWLGIE